VSSVCVLSDPGGGSVADFCSGLTSSGMESFEVECDGSLPVLQRSEFIHRSVPAEVGSVDSVLVPSYVLAAGFDPLGVDSEVGVLFHDLFEVGEGNLLQRFNAWLALRNASRAEHLFAVSEQAAESVTDVTGRFDVRVVGNGFEEHDCSPVEVEGLEPGFVLYVGALLDRKNPGFLLDVAERSDFEFVVAGRTYQDEQPQQFLSEVEGRGLDNVTYLGEVSEDRLCWLYREAGVYFHPARREGYGRTPVEAAQHGTSVVGFQEVPSIKELQGLSAARAFEEFSPRVVAEKIRDFRGEQVFYSPDSWSDVADRITEVFNG